MDSAESEVVADRASRSAAKSKRVRSKSPAARSKSVQVSDPAAQSTPVSSKKGGLLYKRKGTPAPSSAQRALADLEEEEEEIDEEGYENEEAEAEEEDEEDQEEEEEEGNGVLVEEEEIVVERLAFFDNEEEYDPATTNAIRISYLVSFVSAIVSFFRPTLLLHDLQLNESTQSTTKYIALLYFHVGFILAAVAQSNRDAKKRVLQYMMASCILFAAAPVTVLYKFPLSEEQIKAVFFNMVMWMFLLGINLHACYYAGRKE